MFVFWIWVVVVVKYIYQYERKCCDQQDVDGCTNQVCEEPDSPQHGEHNCGNVVYKYHGEILSNLVPGKWNRLRSFFDWHRQFTYIHGR